MADSATGYGLVFATVTDGEARWLSLEVFTGDESALLLARWWCGLQAATISVRGAQAVLCAATSGPDTLVWLEEDGVVVGIAGEGVGTAELHEAAGGLVAVSEAEWAAYVTGARAPFPDDLATHAPGSSRGDLVATGEAGGVSWRLFMTTGLGDGGPVLCVEAGVPAEGLAATCLGEAIVAGEGEHDRIVSTFPGVTHGVPRLVFGRMPREAVRAVIGLDKRTARRGRHRGPPPPPLQQLQSRCPPAGRHAGDAHRS